MALQLGRRIALLVVVLSAAVGAAGQVQADEGSPPAYDISWPQCPNTFPQGSFSFAVIGLNGGRPFTSNPCFTAQYEWAKLAEPNPDVYINVDFPKKGLKEAMTGPYGRCAETDDWCRGYNWGYNLARNSIERARVYGITPGRYWLDVEVDNYWSDSTRNNSQVVRGALDYFLDFNIPVGIYGTSYQWGLITGGYVPKAAKLPLWVAGAVTRDNAARRCGDASYHFAGGETWMVQYFEGAFDGNYLCVADRNSPAVAQPGQDQKAVEIEEVKPVEEKVVPLTPWSGSNLDVLRIMAKLKVFR